MPNSCVAYGCTNRDTAECRSTGVTFHRIPLNPERHKVWLRALRRKDWSPGPMNDSYRVCSDHFLDSDYKSSSDSSNGPRHLKSDAVPSVFKAYPAYLQPPEKKTRRVLVRTDAPRADDPGQPSNVPPVEDQSMEVSLPDDTPAGRYTYILFIILLFITKLKNETVDST